MIALDTSALIGIVLNEAGTGRMIEAIDQSDGAIFGTPTLLEAHMVAYGKSPRLPADIDSLLAEIGAETIDFTAAHLAAALDAFRRFGKGRHPAALNYGDCMAYAIARVAGCALLYKGEDFARTDIRSAL